MKVCVIYVGAYNTFDLCSSSQKNILFDSMNELNLEYDVFISVANETSFYSLDKVQLENTINMNNKISNCKLLNENIKVEAWGTSNRYYIHKQIKVSSMRESFEKLFGKSNIKHFDSIISFNPKLNESIINGEENVIMEWQQKNGTNGRKGKNMHIIPHVFNSSFYKRLKHLSSIIEFEKYDKFIILRPDLNITISKDIINQYLIEKYNIYNKIHVSSRIDIFSISNKFLYNILNEEIYNDLYNNEDKNDENSFHKIIEKSPYKTLHMEINASSLFNKLNIQYYPINIGNVLRVLKNNIVNNNKLSINFRVEYYTQKLDKKWLLNYDEKTEKVYFNYNGDECVYRDQSNPDCYTFCSIHKNFTLENFNKLWEKKREKIPNDKEHKFWKIHNAMRATMSDSMRTYNNNNYIIPMIELFNSDEYFKNKAFLLRPGDVTFNTPIPVITKTFPIITEDSCHYCTNISNDMKLSRNNIILKLNPERHWIKPLELVKKSDIKFGKKNNKIVWRGGPNGFLDHKYRPSRLTFCKKWTNHSDKMIDVGFVGNYENLSGKGRKDISEQLQSKFIISLEGSDVATNLKWIMYSNSVPVMPKPTMCSWLMEDQLEPWVHYVPLENDFSDVEEKYDWCINNLDKCEEIAINSKKYMDQFLDEEREAKITNLVLRKYVDHVTINLI